MIGRYVRLTAVDIDRGQTGRFPRSEVNVPSVLKSSGINIQSLPPNFQKSRWPALKARLFAAQITNKTKRPVSILKGQAKFAGCSLEFSPAGGHG
jgi:hypothetical protein